MKRRLNRAISMILTLTMVVGILPAISLPTKAASNLSGSFEGQDADVFTALGFDTSEIPEGYDEETTSNPYGKDTVTANPVYELLVTGSSGSALYGKDNNECVASSISGIPGSGTSTGFVMSASAAADFDGDGLPGEVVYVGYTSTPAALGTDEKVQLAFCIEDIKTGARGAQKNLGKVSPYYTIPSDGEALLMDVAEYQTLMDAYWQNLLQVTAGDYDGDGVSEIAVYVGEDGSARVDIYKYQKTSRSGANDWLQGGNWSRVWSHAMSGDFSYVPNMISLVSGDFNRDGIDDLGLSYGSVILTEQIFVAGIQYVAPSKAYVLWGDNSEMLQKKTQLDLNFEELGEQTRVSLIKGDLDMDGVEELIATGQPVEDIKSYYKVLLTELGMGNLQRSVTTYVYDETLGMVKNISKLINVVDGEMVSSDISGATETKWQTNNGFDEKYYSLPFMRTNAAAFYPEGSDYTYLYLDSCILQYAKGDLSLLGEMDEKYDGTHTLDAISGDTYWGGRFVDEVTLTGNVRVEQAYYCEYGAVSADINGNGYDTLALSFYTQTPGSADGAHRCSYAVLCGSDSGEFTAAITHGNPIEVDRSVSPEHKTPTATDYSLELNAVTITMVDADVDTIVMEYTGQHYLTYTDPKALAVIAAPPYFKDVDDASGNESVSDNATSWGQADGTASGKSVSVDFSIGAWAENSITTSTGLLKLNGGLQYTLSWEHNKTTSYSYTMTFSANADEDAVAFYSIPTENYVYNVKVPDGKGGYEETMYIVSNTYQPCYQVLSLDYYESIQGNYDSLPPIAGRAITSTPGDPASYPSSSSGYDVIVEWDRDAAGLGYGNGSISQEIEVETEDEESYSMGAEFSFEVGGGLSAQVDLAQNAYESTGGLQFSINPAGGWTTVKMDGTSISGEIVNLPTEYQAYGYYFDWKIFSYNYVFEDKTSIPVVSYIVNDVAQPPLLPEDFQQDYDRTTDEKNVLTWTYEDTCKEFILYKYYDFPVGGGLQEIARIQPGDSTHYQIKYDESGTPYKEFFYEDENLSAYQEYQYAIQVYRLMPTPPLSTPSALLTARTKAAVGYPVMNITESDGENDGKLLVYPDKNAYLTTGVTGPEGERISNYYTTVQYQWQKKEKGAWVDLEGEKDKTLTFASAGVASAGEYRCRVNVLTKLNATAISAYTESVEITHAKRTSYIGKAAVYDVPGGGTELYAEVYNAHSDSASVPSGTVTFNLTNNATGQTYQYFVVLNAMGIADAILEDELPDGMYSVSLYYSGSYIFKASVGECLYLSQRGSGYDIDAPQSMIYGDGGELTMRSVTKVSGVTTAKETDADSYMLRHGDELSRMWIRGAETYAGRTIKGTSYRYVDEEGIIWYFTASDTSDAPTIDTEKGYVLYKSTNFMQKSPDIGRYTIDPATPVGGYVAVMSCGGETCTKFFEIKPRAVTLLIPSSKNGESATEWQAPLYIGDLILVSGEWADCDMENGTLKTAISGKSLDMDYYNTASTKFSRSNVRQLCGSYDIVSRMAIENYDVTYLPGTLTILGAAHKVSLGVRLFEGQSVGTIYCNKPEFGYTREQVGGFVTEQQTGARLVFAAAPDDGYEVYDWYINGEPQSSASSTFVHILLNEDTTVEVQYAIKQNTLSFSAAGDPGGGTITCSDANLISGSVIARNAVFTFDAKANPGYHFKEWRYTEQNNGTVYDSDDSGSMTSSFLLQMPAVSCAVVAVFERDYYAFSFSDDSGENALIAVYENEDGEEIRITSGERIKGGTTITVKPGPGCVLNDEYAFISEGSQGVADYDAGTYVLTLEEDTTVFGRANCKTYDVNLVFDVARTTKQDVDILLTYVLNGVEKTFAYDPAAPSMTIANVPGGANLAVEVSAPAYFDLEGYTSEATKVTASADADPLAALIRDGEAVAKGGHYFYEYAQNGSMACASFIAPVAGTFHALNGQDVQIAASVSRYTISELAGTDTITVKLTEKPAYLVTLADITGKGTYSVDLPDGAVRAASGNKSVDSIVTLHEGDDFTALVTPEQRWTVSYWQVTPARLGTALQYRATSLKYTIPGVDDSFEFQPIFSTTTYNTISWPSISKSANGLTLVPKEGNLSSVSSGSSFRFTLTGSTLMMIDKVYANGYEFTEAGNQPEGSTSTYTKDSAGNSFTIDNITENQVITVTFKTLGITVNGVDISNFSGAGWNFDAQTQTLTLSRGGLTVSGKNNEWIPNLHIVLSNTVNTVIFKDLTMNSSGSDPMIFARSDMLTITAAGTNILDASNGGAGAGNVVQVIGDLTFRGSGSLTINAEQTGAAEAVAVYVPGTLLFTGNISFLAKSGYYGILCMAMNVGVDGSKTIKPNVKVKAPYGINAAVLTTYSGELGIASTYAAVVAQKIENCGSSVMEASATDADKVVSLTPQYVAMVEETYRSYWAAHYPNGYLLRSQKDQSSEFTTKTISADAYNHSLLGDILMTGNRYEMSGSKARLRRNSSYVRVSPVDLKNDDGITLKVEGYNEQVGGYVTYETKLQDTYDVDTYFYISSDAHADGQTGKYSILSLPSSEFEKDDYNAEKAKSFRNETIIAEYTDGSIHLEPHKLLVYEQEGQENVEPEKKRYVLSIGSIQMTDSYDYTLTGSYSIPTSQSDDWNIIYAGNEGVGTLTLDNLTYMSLEVNDNPIYLIGDNYLVSAASTPLFMGLDLNTRQNLNDPIKTYNSLNLYSTDGTGTLTLSTQIERGRRADACTLDIETINLHGVQALTLYGMSPTNTETICTLYCAGINYYDSVMSGRKLSYGNGWLEEVGDGSASSETMVALETFVSEYYVKFYAANTDAYVRPEHLVWDQSSKETKLTAAVQETILLGKVHVFDPTDGNCRIEMTGEETKTLAAEDYSFADGTLALTADFLNALALGEYTLTMYFKDEDLTDATVYTLELPLTVKDSAKFEGELMITPDRVISTRNAAIDLAAEFTGTTPKVYEWSLDGASDSETVLRENGSSAILQIGPKEEVGKTITVKAVSYQDAAGKIVLGTAMAQIQIIPTVLGINISCVGETDSGDGSYMLFHNTLDGSTKYWDFNAEVLLDNGTSADDVEWTLWGNVLRSTYVDADGILTISPNEIGRDGRMTLTAAYTNADGTVTKKTVTIYLSTDAVVGYDPADIGLGTICSAVYGEAQMPIEADGTLIPEGETVTLTAQPTQTSVVSDWLVNGVSVMNNSHYTVNAEENTLTFTAAKMGRYSIAAAFEDLDGSTITFRAGENGRICALYGSERIESGSFIRKGEEVVLTAEPDALYEIEGWTVNGETYDGGTSITIKVEEDTEVGVTFRTVERILSVEAGNGGSVVVLINGSKADRAPSYTIRSTDVATVLAVPDDGMEFASWCMSGEEVSEDGSICSIAQGTNKNLDIKAAFRAKTQYEVSVSSNSYQNGTGRIVGDILTDAYSMTKVKLEEGSSLTLTAVPDVGSILYKWDVDGSEYDTEGDSLIIPSVNADTVIRATFRRVFCEVSVEVSGSGCAYIDYDLSIGADSFSGTITGSESIRAGSAAILKIRPDDGGRIEKATINGEEVQAVWDESVGAYCYDMGVIAEDTQVRVFFAEDELRYIVTAPDEYYEIVEDPEEQPAPARMGKVEVGFVPDGMSEDPYADDQMVSIAPFGAAVLDILPEDGYLVNMESLTESLEAMLNEAKSEAVFTVTALRDCVRVVINGIDMDLDLTQMPNPFAAQEAEQFTISIKDAPNGRILVSTGDVALEDGAKVPAGTILTVQALPDEHYVGTAFADQLELTEETFEVAADTEFRAAFTRSEYVVTVHISGTGTGIFKINDTEYRAGAYVFPADDVLAFTAEANTDSRVAALLVDGDTKISTVDQLDKDLNVSVIFDITGAAVTYTVPENGVLLVLDSEGKELSNGGIVPIGSTVYTITAANEHYQLGSLKVSGTDIKNNSFLVDRVRGNDVSCTYDVAEVRVTVKDPENGTACALIMPEGTELKNGAYVPVGSLLKIVTIPEPEYELDTILVDGAEPTETGWYRCGTKEVTVNAGFRYTGSIPGGSYSVIIGTAGSGKLKVLYGGKEVISGDQVPSGSRLTILAEPENSAVPYIVKVNGVNVVSGSDYTVFGNTVIHADFGSASKGIPYYINDRGVKVYIGFSYDLDKNGVWNANEYIAPEGAAVHFEEVIKEFEDMPGNWADADIEFVTSREIFVGVTDSLFNPNGTTTRAMFVTVLGRLYERSYGMIQRDYDHKFTDCNYSAYYGKYVDWATTAGIIEGYGDGTFGPDKPVTREQMAAMMYRFAKYMGITNGKITAKQAFADDAKISGYAREGVAYCYNNGIVKGRGGNVFDPKANTTRAEMAAFIARYIRVVVENVQ